MLTKYFVNFNRDTETTFDLNFNETKTFLKIFWLEFSCPFFTIDDPFIKASFDKNINVKESIQTCALKEKDVEMQFSPGNWMKWAKNRGKFKKGNLIYVIAVFLHYFRRSNSRNWKNIVCYSGKMRRQKREIKKKRYRRV